MADWRPLSRETRRRITVTEPRLWIEHGYMDVDDFDLAQIARVSAPGWSESRPDTAMLHLGTPGSGISLIGTVS